MKWLLLLSCLIPFWIHSNAQNCELEGVISSEWNFAHTNNPINDDDLSAVTRFASTDITGMTVTGGDTNYLQASFDSVNNILEIRLTPAFAQYEEVTASGTQHIIGINLAFTCTIGSRTLRINQPINDVNNHEPTFLSTAYSYNLPMPFPQNIEVTNFGVDIDAIDIDITNTRVTFSIEPAGDFIITYGGVVDTLNKVHRARIYAARPLRLTQPTLYTLRVTDIGNPQRSTTAQLQITIDEDASLKQSPSFGRAFYITEYAADATNKVDASLDIELHGSTPSSIHISGDYSALFEVSIIGGALNVRLEGSLPEEVLLESTFLALTVEVTVDGAEYNGRTALIVSIPQPETTTTACPTETTITTTACPEPPTTTECAECICTTTEVTPCPETPTTAECVCTTTETTPCPETPTTSECVCTTTEVTPCPETPTTPECVCTTTETTPCPETPTTSECVCTTTEVTPCPETPTTTECDCESTICPSTSTETTCPETTTTTAECICPTTPETTTPETCEPCECNTTTTTTSTTECDCPTTTTTTAEVCLPCPETSTTTECPTLDCALCTTTTTDCPSTPTTTTPVDCPNVCTNTTTTTTDCPQDCSECPTTSTTVIECSTTSTTDPETTTDTTKDSTTDTTTNTTTDTTTDSTTDTTTNTTTDTTPETTTQIDCSLCPTDCSTQTSTTETEKTTEGTTVTTCPTPETSTNCDCTETSTSSTICPETECPLECPSTTTVSNAEPPECTSTTNDCPVLDCSLCTTLTSTTTTTATPPNTGNLRFDEEVYTFRLSPTHDIDYTFQATSSTQEAIVYDLTNTEGPLPTALSFNRDTGRLTNNGYLTSGLYQLLITATGQESEDTATAAVIISVGSAEICEDGSVRTSYAFKLTTVMENTENIVLFKGNREEIADYNFCIEHQYPFQSGIFYINEETGNVENRAIDREAAIFENMDPAQFTLTLQLNNGPVSQNCPITTMSSFQSVFTAATNSTRAGDSRQCVHMDSEIFNEPQKTVLAVVVLDDNDNDPIFETSAMIAGYPKQSLSSRISPPQITRVEATDADIGINAALNYFLENNERVTIHLTTGVLYPSDQIYTDENDFEITVFARDQNGAGRTSQPLRIQIRFLDENHISILTITDVLLEEMDVRLSQIQGSTGIRFRALTASVLPNSEVTRSVRADGATFLRVTGYALDQNDELVETTQLQEVLENVQGLQVQPLPNNNDGDGDNDPKPPVEEESLVGWIAAVSVLSVLLALVIIAGILAYIFIFRKSKSYSHMEEDGATPSTTPAPTPQFQKNSKLEFTGSKSAIDVSDRRSTGYIFGPSGGGDTGETETETDDNKETRKSVSFNTKVERIDIDREAENDSEVKREPKQDTLPNLASDVKKDDAPEIEVHRL